MDKDELTREEIEALSGGAAPGETGGEQIDALRTMHGEYARRLAARLSAMLRTSVTASILDLHWRTFGQFMSRRESSSCCRAVRMGAPVSILLLDVGSSTLHAMMARLLGGDPMRSTPTRRPPTEIEQRLAWRIMSVLVAELEGLWGDALGVRFDPAPAESGPGDDGASLSGALPANEAVVVMGFELGIGRLRGPMRLCVPCRAIEDVGDRLRSGGQETGAAEGVAEPSDDDETGQGVAGALVELRAELARMRIAATEVLDLGIGDIITTDQKVNEPLVIEVDGRIRFHARPGSHDGQKAIQIEKRIESS
jgi:flagellar motor switch protein FliM